MIGIWMTYFEGVKNNPRKTFPHPIRYMMDDIEKTPRRFNSKKYSLVCVNQLSDVRLINHDPKVAGDLFNKQNKNVDKIDETA